MNPAELRVQCLSFPGAEETFPFGPKTSVFKVAGKMFALSQLGADSLRVSLKCEPQLAEALRGAHAAVLPGYHLNKRHWNTVIIDGSVPDDAIRNMIEDSYDLVVSKLPRARRRALGWRGEPWLVTAGEHAHADDRAAEHEKGLVQLGQALVTDPESAQVVQPSGDAGHGYSLVGQKRRRCFLGRCHRDLLPSKRSHATPSGAVACALQGIPRRLALASAETRLDGSSFQTTLEFTFEAREEDDQWLTD
jgi:predicted DNA-binding protein (MmcQ/YjbR family)